MDPQSARVTLARLLVGQPSFPEDSSIDFKEGEEVASEQGVSIRRATYQSRPYLSYYLDPDGKNFSERFTQTIPALLLTPKKQNGKAIVALHQHAMEYDVGKSEPAGIPVVKSGTAQEHGPEIAGVQTCRSDPTQAYGLELALQGYRVLCFDFKPFEDRKYDHMYLQHTWGERYASQEATLDGRSLMGDHVLDTMRAVDVLKSLGHEDIGVIGHSMGGMTAFYAMASDERIKTGAISCGVATVDSVRKLPRVHTFAWAVPGLRREFGEIYSLFNLIAQRPMFISSGTNDVEFPIAGADEFVEKGRKYYADQSGIRYNKFEGPHSFPDDARDKAYAFLKETV